MMNNKETGNHCEIHYREFDFFPDSKTMKYDHRCVCNDHRGVVGRLHSETGGHVSGNRLQVFVEDNSYDLAKKLN